MDLSLGKYNVRDATMRSLLALCHEFKLTPTTEQQDILADISDQLEERVQTEIEQAVKATETPDQEEEMYPEAEKSDVFLSFVDGEVDSVNHKGIIYKRLCNEMVKHIPELGERTTCIKRWGHLTEHEDEWGDVR